MAKKTKKVVKKSVKSKSNGNKGARDEKIVNAREKGVHVDIIAKKHKITPMRVYQILREWR